MGSGWVQIQPIRDRIDFDGHELVRVRDITSIVAAPRARFFERVLALRGLEATKVRIDLSSVAAMLDSLPDVCDLAAFHREVIDPDVCEVGRVVSVRKKKVRVRGVDLNGEDNEPDVKLVLAHLTRVTVGGAYEEALARVRAECDEPKRRARPSRGEARARAR